MCSLVFRSRLSQVLSGRKCIAMSFRQLWQTPHNFAKRIEVVATDSVTVIEGSPVEAVMKSDVRKNNAPSNCPLCEFQDTLTYKDVLILHQFLSPDGHILPRHVTGMCSTMQWKLKNILYQSYSAGLLPDYKPELPIGEDPATYSKAYKWRRNNVYYDDFSIESPL